MLLQNDKTNPFNSSSLCQKILLFRANHIALVSIVYLDARNFFMFDFIETQTLSTKEESFVFQVLM